MEGEKIMKLFGKRIMCLLVATLLVLAPVMGTYVTASAAKTRAQRKASNIRITVSYNANGGTGAPGSHTATVNGTTASFKLSTVVPSRPGYKFIGWRLWNAGTYGSRNGSPGQSMALEVEQSETLVYHAVWESESYPITVEYRSALNDGTTGLPKSHEATVNGDIASYKLSTVVPNRAGYKFLGWRLYSLKKDEVYDIDSPGQSIVIEVSKAASWQVGSQNTWCQGGKFVYYAQWEKVEESTQITVAYNANGGTGAPGNHAAAVNGTIASYRLSTVVPSRSGYKFLGWRLDNDREYDIDRPGQSISIGVGQSGTLVYYAQWEKVAESIRITVSYNANGGTGAPGSHAATVNGTTANYKLSTVVPSRSGYKFLGWRLDNDRAYDIDRPGQSIAIGVGQSGTLVYYAQWEKVAESIKDTTYTITYVLNGGKNHSNNPSSYTKLSGVNLCAPVKTGYTFEGWYLDSGFKTKATGIAKGSTGNKTFYAKWKKNPSPVSTGDIVSVNGGSSAKNAANAGITYYTQSKKYSNKDNKYWNGKVWIGSNGKDYSDKSSASCGICCDVMIASYFGANLTPGDLLQANGGKASWDGDGVKNLMEKKGLTKNTDITNGNMSQKEKKEKLDECLNKYKNDPGHNGPPMVSIDSKNSKGEKSNHFILVVGKDKKGNYIIIDPAVDGRVTLKVPEKKNVDTNNTGYTSYIKGVFTWTKK